MTRILLLLLLLSLNPFNTFAQELYTVGAATVSIEPEPGTYSLSLSGFAAPKEGRFSLKWKKSEAPLKNIREQLQQPQKNGVLSSTNYLSGHYSLDLEGNLYRTRPGTSHPREKITSTGRGRLISITSDEKNLYALNSNDSIWKINLSDRYNPWQLIGRRNNITYSTPLKNIAVIQNRLYGTGTDGAIYEAIHATDNSLSVTTMAIGYKGKKILIIGLDLTGFPGTYINDIKAIIARKHRIPPEAVLVNASHTHFAPVTAGWTTWESFYQYPDSTYLNGVLKKSILNCADKAIRNMQPSSVSYNSGTTAIGTNRRNTADIKRPYDNSVTVLETTNRRTNEKNILFLTACHPVFKVGEEASFALSANYPGVCRDILVKKNGYTNAIFLQGCGGDINPVSSDFVKTGTDLAADVTNIIKSGMRPVAPSPISFFLDAIDVPVTQWSRDSILRFKAANELRAGALDADKNIRWANLMLQSDQPPATVLTEIVQTINFGNIKLIGLSREVVNEYGSALKNLWPHKQVLVAGYCNEVPSYLPRDWHIEQKMYEGYDSFFWYAQPALPPVNIFDILLGQIKKNNR